MAEFKQSGVAFVSIKRAFTLRYLRYHDKLMFRLFSAATGIDWVSLTEGGYGKEFCDRLQETSPRHGVVHARSSGDGAEQGASRGHHRLGGQRRYLDEVGQALPRCRVPITSLGGDHGARR